LRDDDVPFAEYLEDEVDWFASALDMEDRDPVEPALLDSLDAGVVEEPPQTLRERGRGFRLVLDFVEAEPAPRLVEQLDLAARRCVDSEDDFVSSFSNALATPSPCRHAAMPPRRFRFFRLGSAAVRLVDWFRFLPTAPRASPSFRAIESSPTRLPRGGSSSALLPARSGLPCRRGRP